LISGILENAVQNFPDQERAVHHQSEHRRFSLNMCVLNDLWGGLRNGSNARRTPCRTVAVMV
ncbi:MAG: hypothetical protein AAFV51_06425, partial [Pseudomonadota bacterium]